MKILIIPEFGNKNSGTFSFFNTLLRIHLNHHIETAIILEKKQLLPELVQQLNEQNIKIFIVLNRNKFFKLPYLSLIFDIFVIYKRFCQFKPDVIHISNGTPGLMLGSLLFPCSIVFTMHTYPISRIFTTKLSSFLIGIYWLLNKSINEKKRFVTVSHESAKIISKYMKIDLKFIEIIPNGVKKAKYCSNLESQIILTVGHVEWYKNPDIWLKIAQKTIEQRPSARFLWLGDGDLLNEMRVKVYSLDLSHQILFQGDCNNVEKYYSEASIYLQPSLAESQGIAVLEAMSYGLPCIVSNVGGLIESVVDGETGFVCPSQDIDKFVNRLLYLLEDQKLSSRLGLSGKRRMEEHFSIETQEEKIFNLYNTILK